MLSLSLSLSWKRDVAVGGGGRSCQGVQEASGSKPRPRSESAFSADLKRVFKRGRLPTGNPCRCKLRLTGTGPAAAGASVSMFESG